MILYAFYSLYSSILLFDKCAFLYKYSLRYKFNIKYILIYLLNVKYYYTFVRGKCFSYISTEQYD